MTALQVIIKEAKAIRKKSPKMEWKKAVAQASAIYASKHKGKSPVGKKHAVKKKAAKKVAKKKIGYSKTRLKTEKGITKYLKNEPKTLFPYTQEEKIIKAGKKYFDDKAKELHKKGVSGVKKKKVGAIKKSATTMHKDTKSHNVNIRVMSGIKDQLLNDLKKYIDKIELIEKAIDTHKKALSYSETKAHHPMLRKQLIHLKKILKEYQTHAKELKKHI